MKRHLPAVSHLRERDIVLSRLIETIGPCRMPLRKDRFDALVRSILSQQISTAAARTILGRLVDQIGTPRPETLLALSDEEFRACGISPQKMVYLRDLAARVSTGELPLVRIGRLPDEEIIARLVAVKGIGRWTAQMFLMFSLGRPDILPHDDLGVRNAMKRLYELPESPSRSEMDRIAAPWRPYTTVACWYLWRSLEAVPVQNGASGSTGLE